MQHHAGVASALSRFLVGTAQKARDHPAGWNEREMPPIHRRGIRKRERNISSELIDSYAGNTWNPRTWNERTISANDAAGGRRRMGSLTVLSSVVHAGAKVSELLAENYRVLALYYAIHDEVSPSRGRERAMCSARGTERARERNRIASSRPEHRFSTRRS